ncbi:MAG: hypothetical protein K0S31_1459 [Sphingobacterium multivorum]|jgi:hypothetical protein|nr:hypothetical protein [Sphingobacterium multivorum]
MKILKEAKTYRLNILTEPIRSKFQLGYACK